MACSLIKHKRITTTVAKAKALKKFVEPLITKAKDDTTNSRCVVSVSYTHLDVYKRQGKGNYTLGIQEQIIFPEINIDRITRILGMNITFVTSAQTDEEGYALLKEFGLPFKNAKKD